MGSNISPKVVYFIVSVTNVTKTLCVLKVALHVDKQDGKILTFTHFILSYIFILLKIGIFSHNTFRT